MRPLQTHEMFASRFEIEHAAGCGGMGMVYRARDLLHGEPVALKLLHGEGEAGSDSERFAVEAQILSELAHPGIVAHLCHGRTAAGQRFIAMEWLNGHDLAHRLRQGPLSVQETLSLARQVASALSFAHSRGIIHRDLSNKNYV